MDIKISETKVQRYTNVPSVSVMYMNLSIGYAKLTFNQDSQLYEFYNDNVTSIRDCLAVQTVNIAKPAQTWDGTQAVGNAKINARIWTIMNCTPTSTYNSGYWASAYSAYTDQWGKATMLLKDQSTYKYEIEKPEYQSTYTVLYLNPSDTTTQMFQIIQLLQYNETVYITKSCAEYTQNTTLCRIKVATETVKQNITFTNSQTGSFLTILETKGALYTFIANQTGINISILIDGVVVASTNTTSVNQTTTVTIDTTNEIRSAVRYEKFYNITLVIMAILLGALGSRVVKGKSVEATTISLLTLGLITGQYVLFLIAVPGAIIKTAQFAVDNWM